MDEYDRAAREFLGVIQSLDRVEFEKIRDSRTQDPECRSVQSVASHVVASGHSYANYIRTVFGMKTLPRPEGECDRSEIEEKLKGMMAYTVESLEGRWLMSEAEITVVRIQSRWGPVYDLEQMLEHAIVHMLRHRRQVERFLET